MYLNVKNLCIRYPDFVIEDIDLTVEQGEMFVLLGHSGSGKSTLINAIAGFQAIDSGEIVLGEKNIIHQPPHLRNIGMVFQDFALFPHLNVFDNIAFSLKIKNISKSEIREKVEKYLDIIELNGYEKRRIHELSGGEKQRVALARTLISEPELILFDEPLSSIDDVLRKKLREKIKDIQQLLKFTAIYVTHDLGEAFYLADRIGIMSNGKLLRIGTANEIYTDPQSTMIADFLGFKNRFLVETLYNVSDAWVTKISSSINYQEDEKMWVVIKPNHGYFSNEPKEENSFLVTHCEYTPYGNMIHYKLFFSNLCLEEKISRNSEFENELKTAVNKYFNLPSDAICLVK